MTLFCSGDRPFQEPITDVVSTEVLDYLPDEDVSWVLDELFRSARRKVAVTVTTATRTSVLDHGIHVSHRPRPESWWVAQLEAAGFHHPERHWQLIVRTCNAWGDKSLRHTKEAVALTAIPLCGY